MTHTSRSKSRRFTLAHWLRAASRAVVAAARPAVCSAFVIVPEVLAKATSRRESGGELKGARTSVNNHGGSVNHQTITMRAKCGDVARFLYQEHVACSFDTSCCQHWRRGGPVKSPSGVLGKVVPASKRPLLYYPYVCFWYVLK